MCLQNKQLKCKKKESRFLFNWQSFVKLNGRLLKNTLLAFFVAWLGSFSFISVVGARQISRESELIRYDNGVSLNYEMENKIKKMTTGYPIENMAQYIARKDKKTAAFLVAIAKKESNWGKRVPVLNGEDCYNYWGYRGKRKRMGTGGHTCFNSRKDAVDTVAKRIDDLVNKYNRNTPKEMVVWKCGSNCSVTGGQAAADKWIRDVDLYFSKFDF